jgi:hypothetical protein
MQASRRCSLAAATRSLSILNPYLISRCRAYALIPLFDESVGTLPCESLGYQPMLSSLLARVRTAVTLA